MCILCVASRWSRRIVGMLPWLIIPLIILWALSQLLPPGFRFEVTSPRLACVGVLLTSLGWYELVMPRVSQWRSRRTVILRERRRIEAQEVAKWRKEAIRRCRNCYYVYREQNPCGGKFTCTCCGHVSRRPVLHLPNGAQGMLGVSGSGSASSTCLGIWNMRNGRGVEVRGWMEKLDWCGGRGWTGKTCAASGKARGEVWENASDSWLWSCGLSVIWAALGLNWGTEVPGWGDNAGVWFKNEFCSPGEHGRMYYFFKYICLVFLMFKWVLTKRWVEDSVAQDEGQVRDQLGSEHRDEDISSSMGSRGEKARRKAEERRLARLQRKQLEEEERKQREEVARLIEEQRRLRDKKLEAERENEREALAEKQRDIRREKESERRRQEKAKEKEKEKAKELEVEDARKRTENCKDVVKRCETEQVDMEKKGEHKLGSSNTSDLKKVIKGSRAVGPDNGSKGVDSMTKVVVNSQKVCPPKYLSPAKNVVPAVAKTGGFQSRSPSIWEKGFNLVGRSTKDASLSVTNSTCLPPTDENIGKTDIRSSSSAWNRMSWTKGWGKPMGQIESSKGNEPQVVPIDGERHSASLSTNDGVCPLQAPEIMACESLTKLLPMHPSRQPNSTEDVLSKGNNLTGEKVDPCLTGQGIVELSYPCMLAEPVISNIAGMPVQDSSLECVTCSATDPVHVPISTSVLPPISAPQSSNHADGSGDSSIFAPLDISNSFITNIFPSSNLSTVGKSSQISPFLSPIIPTPFHSPTLGSSSSFSKNLVGPTMASKDQPTSLSELRVPNLPSSGHLKDSSREGKWEMWDAPQLSQIELPNLEEPLQWSLPSHNRVSKRKIAHPLSPLPSEPENELPSCLFSPLHHDCVFDEHAQYALDSLAVSAPTNHTLWSDQSAFQSTLRIWDDQETHRRVPPEFLDCITREIMLDPVITADGHSYERSAIESWLKVHDTSPKTGEVLPPLPGGGGTGVDKTLRPNHILRGQIIEYKEQLARGSSAEKMGVETGWSMFTGQDYPAWSTNTTATQTPHPGDFYSFPGSQSLWSYDLSSKG